ncbi:hypothetical protein BDV93DRAFT_157773 [Ceratobasidium sp. AG-I]|nr:hypothetical protein BDV93DRAFT_157773 [Ceratobasidium sp. AG-I]
MPTDSLERPPFFPKCSPHEGTAHSPGEWHGLVCGELAPKCKTEPKNEALFGTGMGDVDPKPRIMQWPHGEQDNVKVEIKTEIVSELGQGPPGDPSSPPINEPSFAACTCSPLMLSLRGSCGHRMLLDRAPVDENMALNQHTYSQPVEQTILQPPSSGLYGESMGAKQHNSASAPVQDSDALFLERIRQFSLTARSFGFYLALIPKRPQFAQISSIGQQSFLDPLALGCKRAFHNAFPALGPYRPDGSSGVTVGSVPLVRSNGDKFRDNTGHRASTRLCPECNRSFSRRYELEDHMFYHTGVKRHCCPNCNKPFRTRANMKRHCREVICV